MQKLVINRLSNLFLTHQDPTHLIVIQHGWLAPWMRATPLGKGLKQMAMQKHSTDPRQNRYLIHIIRANSDDYLFGWIKTQDGIHQGGQRTAHEIKRIVDQYPSLCKLSFIGQSLGGLYVRYALKHLYDCDTNSFYHNLQAANLVSLGTPHLGADDWFKRKYQRMYSAAKYMTQYGLLPSSIAQLLRLDEAQLLHQMANKEEYLSPIRQFENHLIYANVVNDNRVSCSSGLLLPSFDYHGEEQLMKDLFLRHIEDSAKHKVSIVKPILSRKEREKQSDVVIEDICECLLESETQSNDQQWHNQLSNDIEWKRFVVSINANMIDKNMAHGLLVNPIPWYNSCQPLLHHLYQQFCW